MRVFFATKRKKKNVQFNKLQREVVFRNKVKLKFSYRVKYFSETSKTSEQVFNGNWGAPEDGPFAQHSVLRTLNKNRTFFFINIFQ